jgi:hypothetical protein
LKRQRRRTLFEHQEVAGETLGFHWLSEAQRRALLLGELGSLARDAALSSDALREHLVTLLQAHRARRPRSRAEIARERFPSRDAARKAAHLAALVSKAYRARPPAFPGRTSAGTGAGTESSPTGGIALTPR